MATKKTETKFDENTIYILDSYGLIYRSYFAFVGKPLTNSHGENVSALFGFFRNLHAVIEHYKPRYLVCALDSLTPTFRHEMYKEYKATRQKTPEDLHAQIPWIEDVLATLGVPTIRVDGFEADDIIATLATQATESGRPCRILSADKDLMQLVSDTTQMLKPEKGEVWKVVGTEGVKAEWGEPPELMLDLLSLVGDTADNVPGVAGVGPKTACKFLDLYGSLDGIYEHAAEIKGAIGEKIRNGKELAYFSRELIKLRCDVPCGCDANAEKNNSAADNSGIENCSVDGAKLLDRITPIEFNFSAAAEKLKSYEVPAVAKSYAMLGGGYEVLGTSKQPTTDDQQSTTDIKNENLQPSTDNQQPIKNQGNYKSLTSEKDVEKFIDDVLKSKEKCVAFDCETDGLETWKANILGFSLCCKKGECVYVPVASSDGLFSSDGISTEFMVQQLTRLFDNEEVTVVMHNGKFDYECLRTAEQQVLGTSYELLEGTGVSPRPSNASGEVYSKKEIDVSTALDMTHNPVPTTYHLTARCKIFDTMVAAWVLNPERNGKFAYSLETLAETQLHLKGIEYDDIVGKGQTFRDVPLDVATNYCAEDSDFTWQLYKLFEPQLREQKLDTLFWQTEMKLLPILAEMELSGIHIDTAAMNKYNKELTKKISAAEKNIYAEVGHEFNIASTKQLQEVLFTERKLPTGKKTKTGYSTDTSVLEELSHYDAVPRMILEYRELSKLQSTYVESLPKLCDANGRIHTSFIQTGTATGRLSSRDPNLQNIPVRNEEGRRIRSAFTASKGTVLISADYSQIELVVLAHLSGDENMCRAFTDGTDIHKATAALIFGVDANEVTPEMRRTAKTINFGVIYGMSAFRLSNELEISRSQAKTFIDSYFAQYAGIKNFMDGIVRGAEETGYVETIFGRRRNITNINSRNKMEKAAAERVAINTPVQGSAADIVKKAMLDVDAALREKANGARLLLQVHDELILECPDAETTVAETIALLKEKMENAVKLRVPLRVSVESGKAWGEFH